MTQKEQALAAMKLLGIYKPYIEVFRKEDKVCFFERFGGFWVYQEPELHKKMQEIEEEYGCKVYAITHEIDTENGEMYSFLIIPKDNEEWSDLVYGQGNQHVAFAYVWNKTYDDCSEFGDILVQHFGGGIRRLC